MRQRVQCGVHHDPPRGLLADQHSRLEVNEGHKKTHDFHFDSLQVLAYYRSAGRLQEGGCARHMCRFAENYFKGVRGVGLRMAIQFSLNACQ